MDPGLFPSLLYRNTDGFQYWQYQSFSIYALDCFLCLKNNIQCLSSSFLHICNLSNISQDSSRHFLTVKVYIYKTLAARQIPHWHYDCRRAPSFLWNWAFQSCKKSPRESRVVVVFSSLRNSPNFSDTEFTAHRIFNQQINADAAMKLNSRTRAFL
jgi:hypothetical protein